MAAFNVQDHLIDLRGKSYLQVMWRLVWFREEHPDYAIRTELVSHDAQAKAAVFKAEIYDENVRLLSSGYGSETASDFKDYLEKAETKSLGRALAALGYGTQFAPELDEGERIADSPVAPKTPRSASSPKGYDSPTPEPKTPQNAAGRATAPDKLSKEQAAMIIDAITAKNPIVTGSTEKIAEKLKELTGYGSLRDIPPSEFDAVMDKLGEPLPF